MDFSCFLWKNIDLIHLLDPIQYVDFGFIYYGTLADPEPGAGAVTLIYRLQLQLRPKVSATAPQHCIMAARKSSMPGITVEFSLPGKQPG